MNNLRFSQPKLEELKAILKHLTGLDYSDEEAQEAGLAIVRFIHAKQGVKSETKPD